MKESLEKSKNKNVKKGISLIVLVITIIVIVILAVAVILSIANNNPIENANKAKFQNDVKAMQEELELIKAKNYADSNGKDYGTIKFENLTGSSKYQNKFKVVDGELVYTTNLQGDELNWSQELGIKEGRYSFALTGEGSDYGVEDIEFDFIDHVSNASQKKAVKIIKNNLTKKYTSLVITEEGMLYYVDNDDHETEDTSFNELEKEDSWKNSEYIEIPGMVKSISKYFGNCLNAKKIKFAEGVELINDDSFSQVALLEEVELPDTLKDVEFYCCYNLKSITIPRNVKSFFLMGCSSLSSITISSDVQDLSISHEALDVTNIKEIFIPKGVISIGDSSMWGVTEITIEKGSPLDISDSEVKRWGATEVVSRVTLGNGDTVITLKD